MVELNNSTHNYSEEAKELNPGNGVLKTPQSISKSVQPLTSKCEDIKQSSKIMAERTDDPVKLNTIDNTAHPETII